MFSDPDVYVSKTNKEPKSPATSEWYSERYGDDILTISSNSVEKGNTFNIGLYCQFKCKYKLRAYLSDEVELKIGKIYRFNLKPQTSLSYYFEIPKEDYEEFNVVAVSYLLDEFKVFMHKELPSNQKSFPVIPSWAGGYSISVAKGTTNYCTDCKYHVLLQSFKEEVNVQLYGYFQESITTLSPGIPVYDFLSSNKKRCYSFNVDDTEKEKGENILIQTTLFSGNVVLYVGGWNNISSLNQKDLPKISYEEKTPGYYIHHINSENVLWISKSDIEYFNESVKSDATEEDKSNWHFCLYSTQKVSFSMSAYFHRQAERLQKFNVLLPRARLKSYLPANQATKYSVIEFSKNSNVTVIFEAVAGDPEIYGYYCTEGICYFTNEKIKEMLEENKFIMSTSNDIGREVQFNNQTNKCKEQISDDKKSYNCLPLVVISCPGETNCIYNIHLKIENQPLLMSPKTIYHNMLLVGQTDKYQIIVENPEISSVVVVLNTGTGDAELLAYYGKDQKKLAGMSFNDNYMPDVVRITPKKVGAETLIGNYTILVVSKYFSSYNLYYYTISKEQNEQPTEKDVTWDLSEGQVIMDYFPENLNYKLYSFTPLQDLNKEKKDIKFVLTRKVSNFKFKVFKSLSTFKFDKEKKIISGQDWSSNYNKEILIKTTESLYSTQGPYYIVVEKDNRYITPTISHSLSSFYLGVTVGDEPFFLYEGVALSTTLSPPSPNQSYTYTHSNVNNPFELNINMYFGIIEVYISENKITEETLKNTSATFIYSQKEIKRSFNINLNLKNKCKDWYSWGCTLYIYIKKASYSTQFMISGKSSLALPDILIPGQPRKDTVKENEYHYYLIEEIEQRQGSVWSVTFEEGYGYLFLRIPDKPEYGDKIIYPSDKVYTYKGGNSYSGQTIVIPKSVFDRIGPENPKIQWIIAVKGVSNYYVGDESLNKGIVYSISYTSESKRINQNEPYQSSIKSGEYQYFTLFFDEGINNIYISAMNMNGDADIYLNYNDTELPTWDKHDWASANVNHEFMIITKDDPFYKKNNIVDMGGYYTLMVFGVVSTSYTLFISSHDQIVKPLYDNSPSSCLCATGNDKCYFKYDEVYSQSSDKSNEEIIFVSNYLYGNGVMYASLYKEGDIYNKEFFDALDKKTAYDFSNIASNQRNYMKATISKKDQRYGKDCFILLTLKCNEKSLVDINMASLNDPEYEYMDHDRENIYYIKHSNHSTFFNFYNLDKKDLVYEIHSYLGAAKVSVYINDTTYDPVKEKYVHEFVPLGDTEIADATNYFNLVKSSPKTHYKNIVFEVNALENFGFFIKLTYARKWTNVLLNKMTDYYVYDNQFFGYFDVSPEFTKIDFNVNLDKIKTHQATAYIKFNVIDKKKIKLQPNENKEEQDIYHYQIPTEKSHNFKGISDPVLGSINVNLENFPRNTDPDITVRALFVLNIQNKRGYKQKESKVSVLVSPSVNRFQRIDAEPYSYYFGNDTIKSKNTKIYSINKVNPKDDFIYILISSCYGDFSYKISDKLLLFNETIADSKLKKKIEKRKGVVRIELRNAVQNHYYLAVWRTASDEDLDCSTDPHNCELSYMVYYYSSPSAVVSMSNVAKSFDFRSYAKDVFITIPDLKRDNLGEERNPIEFKYDAFVTQDEKEADKMDSVCYLAKVLKVNQRYLDLQYSMDKNEIKIRGLKKNEKYYINILAENLETKELITFNHVAVVAGQVYTRVWFLVVILVIVVLLWGGIAFFFYRKYRRVQAVLKYETGDIRNMSTVPKTESEMIDIEKKSGKMKYMNLSENAQSI